jgi:hypothetical protein
MRIFLAGLTLLALLGSASAFALPSVSLTATASSTIAPATVTLTWTANEVGTCTATGGWSGSKSPTGGTQNISNVLGSTTYGLDCSTATGTVTVAWTAPTTNVDGSPLTNLAGFKIYRSTSTSTVQSSTPIILAEPLATMFVISGLSAGSHYFALKAYNSAGVESVFTGNVTKVVTTATVSSSASVTLEQRPSPPTLVTVQVMAYEIKQHPIEGVILGRQVGTVPLGTPCGFEPIVGLNYFEVPTTSVKFARAPKSVVIVAACALT